MTALVASLPHGCDPAAFVQRHGADAARELVVRSHAFARAQVQLHLERADTTTGEGKDRVVAELHDVFAEIPSGAVREELVALVAQHLGLDRGLVGSWIPLLREQGGEGAASRANPDPLGRSHAARPC
jgi:DNA primase